MQALTPMLVYSVGVAMGTEQWCSRTVRILAVVVAGVLTASHGGWAATSSCLLCALAARGRGGGGRVVAWRYPVPVIGIMSDIMVADLTPTPVVSNTGLLLPLLPLHR